MDYISAGLDCMILDEHPEWQCVYVDPNTLNTSVASPLKAGFHRVCFNSPYTDYLCEQIKETVHLFPNCDGIFLDIISQPECCCPYCREQLRPAPPEDLCLYCRRSLHARCPKQQLLKQMLKPQELQEYHMQRHRILPEHHQRNDSHVPDPEKDCHRRRDCHRKQFPRGLTLLRGSLLLRGLLQMKCRCRLLS